MIQLNKIYFDGKSYVKDCIESNKLPENSNINICSRFNLTPVDSISFENYQPQTYCDITINDYHIQGVPIKHLYTDINNSRRTILYPSHNPTPDPGGLY